MQRFCFQARNLTWQLHDIKEETAIILSPKLNSGLEGLVYSPEGADKRPHSEVWMRLTGAYVLLLLWSFMSFLCFLSWSFPRVAWVSGIHWLSWFTSFKISLLMFFTTFNIKAEVNRIIFVFPLSLPKERSRWRFLGFRAAKSTTPQTVVSTPMECCRGNTGSVKHLTQAWEGYRMSHRSPFLRVPHRTQTSFLK